MRLTLLPAQSLLSNRFATRSICSISSSGYDYLNLGCLAAVKPQPSEDFPLSAIRIGGTHNVDIRIQEDAFRHEWSLPEHLAQQAFPVSRLARGR